MIEALFPESVICVVADAAMSEQALAPEEAACVRRAVPKRLREFRMGRACAREALRRFGIENYSLLPGPDRAPRWPDGIVGSVTHCEGYCAVAVASRDHIAGLGVDAEPAEPLPSDVISQVLTENESVWCNETPPPPHGDWRRLVFSAKESVYKCQYPVAGLALEFSDVELEIEPRSGGFTARLRVELPSGLGGLRHLRGRYLITAHHIVTGVALATAQVR